MCQVTAAQQVGAEKYTSLWVCLFCGLIHCGRMDASHAIAHYKAFKHDLVMNIETGDCW